MELGEKSFKAQMKAADRLKAKYAVIFGESEYADGMAALKDMEQGNQENIPIDNIDSIIKNNLR